MISGSNGVDVFYFDPCCQWWERNICQASFLLFFVFIIFFSFTTRKVKKWLKGKPLVKDSNKSSYFSALWFLYFCIIRIYKYRPRIVKVVSVKDIVYFMQHVDIAYACCSMWSCFLWVQDNLFSLSFVALMCSVIRRHTPHFENLFLCGKCIPKCVEVAEQDLINHYETKNQSPNPSIASNSKLTGHLTAPSFCLLILIYQVKSQNSLYMTLAE